MIVIVNANLYKITEIVNIFCKLWSATWNQPGWNSTTVRGLSTLSLGRKNYLTRYKPAEQDIHSTQDWQSILNTCHWSRKACPRFSTKHWIQHFCFDYSQTRLTTCKYIVHIRSHTTDLKCTSTGNSFISIKCCACLFAKHFTNQFFHSWNTRWTTNNLNRVHVIQRQLWKNKIGQSNTKNR